MIKSKTLKITLTILWLALVAATWQIDWNNYLMETRIIMTFLILTSAYNQLLPSEDATYMKGYIDGRSQRVKMKELKKLAKEVETK